MSCMCGLLESKLAETYVGPIFKTIKVLSISACVGIFTSDSEHARYE
jgi:hypothetical protein